MVRPGRPSSKLVLARQTVAAATQPALQVAAPPPPSRPVKFSGSEPAAVRAKLDVALRQPSPSFRPARLRRETPPLGLYNLYATDLF